MDVHGRENILAVFDKQTFGRVTIFPDERGWDEPFIDIIFKDSVLPSDVLDALRRDKMAYRTNGENKSVHGLPVLKYLGSTTLRGLTTSTDGVAYTFEDTAAA